MLSLIFCRPVLASSMDGYGIYPDAPEMPFVIPTMLLRPFKLVWRPVINALEPLLLWLFNFVVYCFQEAVAGGSEGSYPTSTLGLPTPTLTSFAPDAEWGIGQDAYI